MNKPNELPIPPIALEHDDSVELIRVWIADEGLRCSLKIGMYTENGDVDETMAWGVIFSDTIRHIASALHQKYGVNETNAREEIFTALSEEIAKQRPNMSGSFVDKNTPD